jgi:uncharacterized membrane protein
MLATIELFQKAGILWIFRWWHVIFGVCWIGLLYYFNFVQVPSFPTMEAAHRNGAIDKLVPRALWYFRYAALGTAITGLFMLAYTGKDYFDNGASTAGNAILMGSLFGLVMLANVWLIIWPNQKTVIENARGLLAGKAADPGVGAAGRKALLASRTNAIFSIPMLMFMTGTQNYFAGVKPTFVVVWIVVLAVVVVLELSALGFIGGMEGPLTKPLASHKNIAHIGVPVALVILLLWQFTS